MQVYVPGPCSLWVAVPVDSGSATPVLLGYGEQGVTIAVTPAFDRVMNDLGGNQLPFDRLFQGEEGAVSTVLTVLNWSTYESIAMNRPFHGSGSATPGTTTYGDMGTLMWGEQAAMELWVRFPYATAFGSTFPGMVSGYHFFNAHLLSSTTQFNTSAAKIPVQFECYRSFDYTTHTWSLYDHSMTGTSVAPAA